MSPYTRPVCPRSIQRAGVGVGPRATIRADGASRSAMPLQRWQVIDRRDKPQSGKYAENANTPMDLGAARLKPWLARLTGQRADGRRLYEIAMPLTVLARGCPFGGGPGPREPGER